MTDMNDLTAKRSQARRSLAVVLLLDLAVLAVSGWINLEGSDSSAVGNAVFLTPVVAVVLCGAVLHLIGYDTDRSQVETWVAGSILVLALIIFVGSLSMSTPHIFEVAAHHGANRWQAVVVAGTIDGLAVVFLAGAFLLFGQLEHLNLKLADEESKAERRQQRRRQERDHDTTQEGVGSTRRSLAAVTTTDTTTRSSGDRRSKPQRIADAVKALPVMPGLEPVAILQAIGWETNPGNRKAAQRARADGLLDPASSNGEVAS